MIGDTSKLAEKYPEKHVAHCLKKYHKYSISKLSTAYKYCVLGR